MILPSKHLSHDKALLTVGCHILKLLSYPKTVSALWTTLSKDDMSNKQSLPRISYDWFVLSLDILYLLEAIEIVGGLISRRQS